MVKIPKGTLVRERSAWNSQNTFLHVVAKCATDEGVAWIRLPRKQTQPPYGAMAMKMAVTPLTAENCLVASTLVIWGTETVTDITSDGTDTITCDGGFTADMVGAEIQGDPILTTTTIVEVLDEDTAVCDEDVPDNSSVPWDGSIYKIGGPFTDDHIGMHITGTGIDTNTYVESRTSAERIVLDKTVVTPGLTDVDLVTEIDHCYLTWSPETSQTEVDVDCTTGPVEVAIVGASDGTSQITSDDDEFTVEMNQKPVTGTDVPADSKLHILASKYAVVTDGNNPVLVPANDPNTFTVTLEDCKVTCSGEAPNVFGDLEGWEVTGDGVDSGTYVVRVLNSTELYTNKPIDVGTPTLTFIEPVTYVLTVNCGRNARVSVLIPLDEGPAQSY